MKGELPERTLCELLNVSRSGYHRWQKAPPSRRQQQDKVIAEYVAQAHARSRKTYGAPRLVDELRDDGVRISKRRCARLMKQQGLSGRKKRAWRPQTTNSKHQHRIAPHLLKQRTAPTGPNQVWAADITYLRTGEGWLYLAAIIDLWSRRIVGWACSPTMHVSLVLEALARARRNRRPGRRLILHSDQGVQYACREYRRALAAAWIRRSMSRRGNCYDNATMESFWATLKSDTGLDHATPISRRAAELIVFDYIETFYNRTRRHSSLGNKSPVAFEKQPTKTDIKAA